MQCELLTRTIPAAQVRERCLSSPSRTWRVTQALARSRAKRMRPVRQRSHGVLHGQMACTSAAIMQCTACAQQQQHVR